VSRHDCKPGRTAAASLRQSDASDRQRWPGLFPTTSTLIYGEREAILVDAQFIKNDIDELGNLIEELGKTLTTIFITHGHPDHYFGIDVLAERFPGVRVVAARGKSPAGDTVAR
jgi:glyoxylase-like metal-dependent hydrolase (beta-lactamase superfamily II)